MGYPFHRRDSGLWIRSEIERIRIQPKTPDPIGSRSKTLRVTDGNIISGYEGGREGVKEGFPYGDAFRI